MTEAERKLAIGIGICTKCILEHQGWTPRRKTFRSAFKRNLRRSLETLGEWVTPHTNCTFEYRDKCLSDWNDAISLSSIDPKEWSGKYFAAGSGKSASVGLVIAERKDGVLVGDYELPTHKSTGKTFNRYYLNGSIRLVKRNIKVFKAWSAARNDFNKRQLQ